MRALAVALVFMFVPTLAWAQSPAPIAPAADPSECVTTTTVRCTGAAARYAVPTAPPTVVVPVPPPAVAVPVPAATAAPAPPLVVIDPRLLGGGWRVVHAPDGSLWRERKVSTDAPAVWGTGLAFFAGSYFIGASVAQVQGNPLLWWPVIGAFWTSSFVHGQDQILSAVDGVMQAGGFVTFLVGLATGPEKLERLPLTIGPMAVAGGGSGIAIAGRF
jgi:hypothetical protein